MWLNMSLTMRGIMPCFVGSPTKVQSTHIFVSVRFYAYVNNVIYPWHLPLYVFYQTMFVHKQILFRCIQPVHPTQLIWLLHCILFLVMHLVWILCRINKPFPENRRNNGWVVACNKRSRFSAIVQWRGHVIDFHCTVSIKCIILKWNCVSFIAICCYYLLL